MTYVEKTSYFEVAPPGHTIAYKNIDNLFKNCKYIFYFVMLPKIWCLRNVQIFIDVSYGVLIL